MNWNKVQRTEVLKYWQDLLNIEGFRTVLITSERGIQYLQASQPGVILGAGTLRVLFPDAARYSYLQLEPKDPIELASANEGIVPPNFRNSIAMFYLTFWSNGYRVQFMPTWVLGIPWEDSGPMGMVPFDRVVEVAFPDAYPQLLRGREAAIRAAG